MQALSDRYPQTVGNTNIDKSTASGRLIDNTRPRLSTGSISGLSVLTNAPEILVPRVQQESRGNRGGNATGTPINVLALGGEKQK